MIENQVSLTAFMTALIRAYHAQHGDPKVFDDFLAYNLIPQDKRELIEQILPKEALLQATNAISRARYTEDLLQQAVCEGVKQYVILGAGMDTFAFRRPELVEQLQVIEVDHPDTQDFKRRRIAELGWVQPEQLHFIPIDFVKENLAKTLIRSATFNPMIKSFFSLLGVTMYLSTEEVFSVLRSVHDAAPVGSIVVFDYYDVQEFITEKASVNLKMKEEMMQKLGEPMKTGFEPSKLDIVISELGFRLYENLSPTGIEERYFRFGKNRYHAHQNVYFACAVIE